MKIFKKFSVLLLTVITAIGGMFVFNKNESYAATSYKRQLILEKLYKYDLDGDKDYDNIKVHRVGNCLYLIVNGASKKLTSNYYVDDDYMTPDWFTVRIYDLNKKDKSLDIVFTELGEDNYNTIKIIKFKNKTCKVEKSYYDVTLKSYNPDNGMVTFEEYEAGRYNSFEKAIGCFCVYDNVKVNGYSVYNQYTANTSSFNRKNKYIAAKNLTAYTSTSGTKRAFTIKKGYKAYIYALYQNGSKRYIKVKNSAGKYGYVKVGSSMLFTKESCLWWR